MEDLPTTIRLFGTAADSIVDGPGLRYSVFTQGCPHRCPGCHNPASQPSQGGYVASIADVVDKIAANRLIQGVTISGGEPLAQSAASLNLARQLKAKGFDIWLYTGYRFEDILEGTPDLYAVDLVFACDVLVDGPFIESQSSYDLAWKGSSNQRVIDIPRSIEAGEVVLWETHEEFPEVPDSW